MWIEYDCLNDDDCDEEIFRKAFITSKILKVAAEIKVVLCMSIYDVIDKDNVDTLSKLIDFVCDAFFKRQHPKNNKNKIMTVLTNDDCSHGNDDLESIKKYFHSICQ